MIRNGAAYALWGTQGLCGAGLEVVAASGKSCGCVQVPYLASLASIGRDGSLIVPGPVVNSSCRYHLYPQLLK